MFNCRSSEGYYREALRVYELIYKEDSPQLLKVVPNGEYPTTHLVFIGIL